MKALPKALEIGWRFALTASLVSEMALRIRSMTAVACTQGAAVSKAASSLNLCLADNATTKLGKYTVQLWNSSA